MNICKRDFAQAVVGSAHKVAHAGHFMVRRPFRIATLLSWQIRRINNLAF
jgi:hypothetical protein